MRAMKLAGIFVMALAVSASASVIQFDPDGSGPGAAVNAASLDFLPGDAMILYQGGSTGTLFYQAKLGSVVGADGNPIPTPGLNGPAGNPNSYEITAVFGVDLNVTVVPGSPSMLSFSTLSSPGSNAYYSLYFDHSMNANNLAGTGFRDGTRIFSASINYALGSAAVDQSASGPLDQVNPGNFATIQTPRVAGGGTVAGPANSVDPAFFPNPSSILGMVTTGTIAAPFTYVDPSMGFVVGADGFTSAAPYLVTAMNGDSGELAVESDAATSFTAVPEPASLCLLPLAALAFRRRRNDSL